MKWVFTVVFFLALTQTAGAQEFNAGFVQGLWYGDEEVFADDATRIYVAIRNNTGADLTGTVEFFDGDKRLERNNVSALDGRIIESWSDWTPSYGEHTITATLSRIELHQVGEGTEAVEVVSALAESIIFVDYDTDNDGVGNKDDTDDDDDGVSDEDEEENGTDPLDDTDPTPEEDSDDDSGNDDEDSESNSSDGDGGGNSASAQTESNSSGSSSNSDDPEGLEQFFTESRADTVLSSITDVVNNTKRNIDGYRDTRNSSDDKREDVSEEETNFSSSDTSTASTSSTTNSSNTTDVEEDGFGEVTRTQNDSGKGFFATITEIAKVLLSSTYTLILFLISFYLGHPIIVQLTLLFLILFLMYKVARRLGNRQNY